MSKRRTERLLSIVVLLLSTRRYLTAEQIREAVSGYPERCDTFKRMFERDKEELRDLGIPLETGRSNPLDEEPGYRISRQDYELPEIHLTADEAAVLGIAARVWQSAELSGAAVGALLKLKAAGGAAGGTGPDGAEDDGTGDEADDGRPGLGIEPRLTTQEPAFGPLWEAVRDRRPVTFSYRAAGRSDATRREIEPWGVVNRRGHWYVAARDRARNDVRVFRMGRIDGPVKMAGPAGSVTVPPGTDVRKLVESWDSAPSRVNEAALRVRQGAGHGLRRHARPDGVAPDPGNPGWDLVTTRFSDVKWYGDYVASFGPDAVVLGPPDLREAVIARLKGVLA